MLCFSNIVPGAGVNSVFGVTTWIVELVLDALLAGNGYDIVPICTILTHGLG